jgi:hypothetical protein
MTRTLILTAALATATFAAVPAQAGIAVHVSFGGDHGDTHYARRMGVDRGLEDGRHKAWEDVNRRRSPSVRRHEWYREGDRGYRHSFGPRREYVVGYRDGFERAYRDAYRQARRHEYRDRDRDRDRDDRYGRDDRR